MCRICKLEAVANERDLDQDEEEELKQIRTLSPDEDIKTYHNFIDTNGWIESNEDIYRKYLQDALDAFEDGTGLRLA